jgi:hypothetical protein
MVTEAETSGKILTVSMHPWAGTIAGRKYRTGI